MPQSKKLRLAYAALADLVSDYEANLRRGRAFVAGAAEVAERELCEVEIIHPVDGETLLLRADAVWIKADEPGAGVGVKLEPFGDLELERLRAFLERTINPDAGEVLGADAESNSPDRQRGQTVYDRIRHLSQRERDAVARQGTLPERVALERCYGGAVWESLLQNAQLTPPEVMRIARNGTVTQPLISVIVANAAWLSKPEVQRALLSNPRVGGAHLERVLRALSPVDLSRVAQQGSYRMPVRAAAKKLLGR